MVRKVSPGTPFRPDSAADHNLKAAAAEDYQRRANGAGDNDPTEPTSTDVIQVRNDSGADRRAGEILQCTTTAILTALHVAYLRVAGDAPTGPTKFGILRKPLPNNTTARVLQLSGVCMALVNVSDTDHGFATVDGSLYVLKSATTGPVEILLNPSGTTGEQQCIVRFSGSPEDLCSIHIKTRAGGIPARVGDQDGSAYCDELSMSPTGQLAGIGTRLIYNCSDEAVGSCKVGLASPVRATDGAVNYVIVVESCTDVTLYSGGGCPDDGISGTADAGGDPGSYPPVADGYCRLVWLDGGGAAGQWLHIGGADNCSCSELSNDRSVVPVDPGTINGETQLTACTQNWCQYESDGVGGWTLVDQAGSGSCNVPTWGAGLPAGVTATTAKT